MGWGVSSGSRQLAGAVGRWGGMLGHSVTAILEHDHGARFALFLSSDNDADARGSSKLGRIAARKKATMPLLFPNLRISQVFGGQSSRLLTLHPRDA